MSRRSVPIVLVLALALTSAAPAQIVLLSTGKIPGDATDLPARFTMTYLFQRQNVGLASAAATSLMLGVGLLLACGAALRRMRGKR